MPTSGRTAYLDSSAIVKLVVAEAESDALHRFLAGYTDLATSILAEVDVIRAVRPANPSAVPVAREVFNRIQKVDLSDSVVAMAALIEPPLLRSLDAIHVASALLLESSLDVLISYDRRMLDAACTAGIPTASPA